MTKIFSVSCSDALYDRLKAQKIGKSHAFRVGAQRLLNQQDDVQKQIIELSEKVQQYEEGRARLSRRIAEQQIELEKFREERK